MAMTLLKAFAKRLNEAPTSLPEMMSALMFYNDSPTQVCIFSLLQRYKKAGASSSLVLAFLKCECISQSNINYILF